MADERAAEEIAPGLWRWTAHHPAWKPDAERDSPGDWDQDVGCVLFSHAQSAVFLDPQLPADTESFWRWCDGSVGSRSVHVLTTIRFHGRSREAVADRYGGEVVTSLRTLPDGVRAFRFRAADETMFWLPAHAALVPGDLIIGDATGGVRLCPESWLGYMTPPPRPAELRTLLRPLLELPVARILVSHGQPLLTGGAAALQRILA
jgi:hypothetical protein